MLSRQTDCFTWRTHTLVAVLGLALFSPGQLQICQAVVLYDASLGSGPSDQGWIGLTNPLISQATQTVVDGVFTLDTFATRTDQAGFFSQVPALSLSHPEVATMDLEEHDFAIDFALRIVASDDLGDTDPRHASERNRGGFAVIAMTEQGDGVEFQFQHDQIISLDNRDSGFPLAEGVSIDTTDSLRRYRLVLSQEGYRLMTDSLTLLQGPLRDYSSVAPDPPFDFPYTTPSFFFFGDNTARARGITELTLFAAAPLGDCNHDQQHSVQDFTCFEDALERDAALDAMRLLVGDIDGDGLVAFADFLTLSSNFGVAQGRYAEGNLDLQRGVEFEDFLLLSQNLEWERSGTWCRCQKLRLCAGWLCLGPMRSCCAIAVAGDAQFGWRKFGVTVNL